MKNKISTIIGLAVVLAAGCSQPTTEQIPARDSTASNIVDATSPDASSKKQAGYILPGLEHGFEQSPINIVSGSNKGGEHSITLYFKDEVNKVENLGHTVQLDFAEGSTITQDDTTFNFKQCHFHTPSEHLIDGMTYPLEMHIVNIMPNEDKNATPQYLVIGVLFKQGKKNKFIEDFLSAVPKEEHESDDIKAGSVKLADLFGVIPKKIKGNYYYYKGSLTTPPFTESVRWYLSKNIFEASAEQIATLNRIEGNNARHVQALYGRDVSSK